MGTKIRYSDKTVSGATEAVKDDCAKKRIIDSFKYLECPQFESVWLGPFEQLTGAGYSLLAATRHGINERDLSHYNSRVQSVVVSEIQKMFTSSPATDYPIIGDWLSGFYFNSAIQRLVWAGERLLLTLATVKCPCGRESEPCVAKKSAEWKDVLSGSLRRLHHVQNEHQLGLENCRAMREQFILRDENGKERGYQRKDNLDRSKVLAMLRYSVNNRKHKVFLRTEIRDQESAGKGDDKTWSTSGADLQSDLAVEAFDLLSRAYLELKTWNENA